MRILVFFCSILVSINCLSQTPKKINVNGDYVNRDKITKQNVYNFNLKQKDRILNLDKYLDTLKTIVVLPGHNGFAATMQELRSGFYPLAYFVGKNYKSALKIQLVNGKLKLNSSVDGFDGKYVVRIVNNKIITSSSDFHLYASDRYFELFDEYYIPVLQIEISKKENAIKIGGAFNCSSGYLIIDSIGEMNVHAFGMDKLDFTEHERDSIFKDYKEDAKLIKPIHE